MAKKFSCTFQFCIGKDHTYFSSVHMALMTFLIGNLIYHQVMIFCQKKIVLSCLVSHINNLNHFYQLRHDSQYIRIDHFENSFYHRRYNDDIGIDWSNGHKGILHSGYSGK